MKKTDRNLSPTEFVVKYSPEGNRNRLWMRLSSHFSSRLKNGWYAQDIKCAFRFYCRERSPASRQLLINYLARYFFGDRLSGKIFSKNECIAEYCPDKYLYHFTPIENYNNLCQNGIISENGKVYLTSDPDSAFMHEFFDWKAHTEKKDITFVSVKIDALHLSEKHRLYYGNSMTEMITDKVEPEFLIV